MTEVEILKDAIAEAWSGKTHYSPLRGPFPAPSTVRPGGLTDALITVAATAVQEHYAARLERLSYLVDRLACWSGNDIADLIREGYIEEGDLV